MREENDGTERSSPFTETGQRVEVGDDRTGVTQRHQSAGSPTGWPTDALDRSCRSAGGASPFALVCCYRVNGPYRLSRPGTRRRHGVVPIVGEPRLQDVYGSGGTRFGRK